MFDQLPSAGSDEGVFLKLDSLPGNLDWNLIETKVLAQPTGVDSMSGECVRKVAFVWQATHPRTGQEFYKVGKQHWQKTVSKEVLTPILEKFYKNIHGLDHIALVDSLGISNGTLKTKDLTGLVCVKEFFESSDLGFDVYKNILQQVNLGRMELNYAINQLVSSSETNIMRTIAAEKIHSSFAQWGSVQDIVQHYQSFRLMKRLGVYSPALLEDLNTFLDVGSARFMLTADSNLRSYFIDPVKARENPEDISSHLVKQDIETLTYEPDQFDLAFLMVQSMMSLEHASFIPHNFPFEGLNNLYDSLIRDAYNFFMEKGSLQTNILDDHTSAALTGHVYQSIRSYESPNSVSMRPENMNKALNGLCTSLAESNTDKNWTIQTKPYPTVVHDGLYKFIDFLTETVAEKNEDVSVIKYTSVLPTYSPQQ